MIDWEAFADEVPTEPRSVLVLCEDEYTTATWLAVYNWNAGSHDWEDGPRVVEDGAKGWRAAFRDRPWMTHWAYVDPPGEQGAIP